MSGVRRFLTGHHPDDRGVVAVFTAIALAVLIGFVGFAVDVGTVYNERRQEQSAVDVAVLSGAREFLLSFDVQATDAEVFEEVVRLSHANMIRPPSLSEWRAAFFDCTDPDRAARDFTKPLIVDGAAVDCVSKREDERALRVRLPDTEVDTYFAGVIGFDMWTVSATAEAGLTRQPGNPNIIPYALSSIGDGNGVVCLRTPPNGHAAEDCEGSEGGNFGHLAIPRPSLAINQNCDGGFKDVMIANLAMGIDHELSERLGPEGNFSSPKIEDLCEEIAAGNKPNHLFAQTGGGQGLGEDVLMTGLIEGSNFDDGGPARLKRYPEDAGWPTRCLKGSGASCSGGHVVDNKAFWEFFDPSLDYGGSGAPAECEPDEIRDTADPRPALELCLQLFQDGADSGQYTAPLVTEEILDSPRFTWLPESWTELADNWREYDIRRFRPVFLQTLYYSTGNQWWAIDPGTDLDGEYFPPRGTGGSVGGKLTGLSAIALQTAGILPQHIEEEGPTAGAFESRIALLR